MMGDERFLHITFTPDALREHFADNGEPNETSGIGDAALIEAAELVVLNSDYFWGIFDNLCGEIAMTAAKIQARADKGEG